MCLHRHIDLLNYTEPATFISIPDSPISSTLTRTTDKDGYVVYITPHSHTYIRQNTLLTRLITQRSSHAGRLHVFILKGDNGDNTAVIGIYAFQRDHKTHSTSPHTPTVKSTHPRQHNNPKHLKQDLLTLINDLKTVYQQLTLLIIGDLQHTVRNNTLHRMGHPQPLHQQTSSSPVYILSSTWYRLFRLSIRTNDITRDAATQEEDRLT